MVLEQLKLFVVVTTVILSPGDKPIQSSKPLIVGTTAEQCLIEAFEVHGEMMSEYPYAYEIRSRCE